MSTTSCETKKRIIPCSLTVGREPPIALSVRGDIQYIEQAEAYCKDRMDLITLPLEENLTLSDHLIKSGFNAKKISKGDISLFCTKLMVMAFGKDKYIDQFNTDNPL